MKLLRKLREKSKSETSKFGRKMTEQIPIRLYKNGYFILKHNRIMNIFEVQGRSYMQSNKDELESEIYKLAEYFRMQKEEIKIVFMNYPTDSSQQQEFLKKKLKTANPMQEKWIKKELATLHELEIYRTDRLAFIFIFANNESSYNQQIEMLKSKSSLSIKEIDFNKKLTVLRKLNNMNKSIKV